MIDAELFDKICAVLRLVRQDPRPFGGVQLVLCGDFCQLPPVNGDFCFEGEAWDKARIHVCHLETLVRQQDDSSFQEILGELRWGRCDDSTLARLKEQFNTAFPNDIQPTILYSKNVNVDKINIEALEKLKETSRVQDCYVYKTIYSSHPSTIMWCSSLKIPESVECCVGAQVMITQNLATDPSVVNGSRGVVTQVHCNGVSVRLIDRREIIVEYSKLVHEDNADIYVSFVPLRLAYAITIHKSQGMTLDAVEMDLGTSIFEYGQAYTALSRARSLNGLRIKKVAASSFRTHPRVLEFYKNLE